MHELSIATHAIHSVLEVARENGLTKVERVHLVCGEMKQIVPEAMQIAFAAVTEGTLAEGAVLELSEVPMKGTCRACGASFRPELGNYVCPQCGQAAVEIVEGDEILLQTVEGKQGVVNDEN